MKALRAGLEYRKSKTGPLTTCYADVGAFIKSSDAEEIPDIQIHQVNSILSDHARTIVPG
jgi:hypothetical protein